MFRGLFLKIILFIILFTFTGCNIEFGWAGDTPENTQQELNTTTQSDTNETNQEDVNTTINTDTNETNQEINTTTSDENTTIITNTESDFEKENAILDTQACGAFDGFLTMKDNSFDPEGFYDSVNGITIGSSYQLSFSPKNTEIVLFYPNLTTTKTNDFRTIYENNYYISFDKAWIGNIKRTIYIKTPILETTNNKYGCYRYELNSISSNINGIKVYRYN